MNDDAEPKASAGLATNPIPAGRTVRVLLRLAFLAPSLAIAQDSLRELFSPRGAPPSAALALLVALAWVALVLAPRPGALWVDLGRLILARFGFLSLACAALLALLVASAGQGGLLLLGLAGWLAVMSCAALVHAAAMQRARLVRTLVIVGINVALFCALDFAVRAFVLPHKSHNNLFIQHDPDLGWKLRPNLSVEHRTDLYSTRESINSLGFRTAEVPFEKPPGTRRIVVLGDSHSEAYTVNDGETWCALLERELGHSGPVQVISLGVGGFSTDQELLAYLRYGRRFQPDLVLLQVCENDVEFNLLDHYWRGRKPLFERHGEQLFLTGVPVPNLRNTGLFDQPLLRHSAIAVLLESMLRQVAIDREVQGAVDLDEAWRVTALVVRDLARLVREDGARFAAFDVSTRNLEFDQRLRAILAERGVPYLETDAAYVDEYPSYWYAGHWNPKGQRAAAAVLAPQVAELLARPAPGAVPVPVPVDGTRR